MKEIIIKKIGSRNNNFVAYYKSPILEATYSVCFKDNICGAVALTNFYKMIQYKYEGEEVNLRLSNEMIKFKNQVLLQIFAGTGEEI